MVKKSIWQWVSKDQEKYSESNRVNKFFFSRSLHQTNSRWNDKSKKSEKEERLERNCKKNPSKFVQKPSKISQKPPKETLECNFFKGKNFFKKEGMPHVVRWKCHVASPCEPFLSKRERNLSCLSVYSKMCCFYNFFIRFFSQ